MKNHVLRPLWVALGVVALLLIARILVVPDDFGVHGRNFTYGFHREGSVTDWANFPVKYKGKEECGACHEQNYEDNMGSKHARIECENCHGPALDHPDNPAQLVIDRDRALCLRCHATLRYPGTARGAINGIDPDEHNPEMECADCHNPHYPDLEA